MSKSRRQALLWVVLIWVRLGPHPLIVTTKDDGDDIRAFMYCYYATISGWRPNPTYGPSLQDVNSRMIRELLCWHGPRPSDVQQSQFVNPT